MIKHYYGLSRYTVYSSRGYQLGNTYMKLSVQALQDDDKAIKIRSMKSKLEELLFRKLEVSLDNQETQKEEKSLSNYPLETQNKTDKATYCRKKGSVIVDNQFPADIHTLGDSSEVLKPLFEHSFIPQEKLIIECKHYEYCRVKDFGRINCLTKDSIETCMTYKFYEKYKDFDYGRQLGI